MRADSTDERPAIRPVAPDELERVLPLFADYQRFYGVKTPDIPANRQFLRGFIAPSDRGELIAAWDDGRVGGVREPLLDVQQRRRRAHRPAERPVRGRKPAGSGDRTAADRILAASRRGARREPPGVAYGAGQPSRSAALREVRRGADRVLHLRG